MWISKDANSTLQCNTLISLTIPHDYFPPIIAAVLLLYVTTIFSNCILIYALCKTKQLNTISNKLILVMSVSDLALGAIAFPAAVLSPSLRDIFKSCSFEKIGIFLLQIFSYFSILVLTCISIDRYLRVTKMNRYNLYMNKYRMKVMVLISLLAAAVVSTVSLLRPSFEQQIFVVCFDVVVVGFTAVVYMFLLKKLQNHAGSLRKSMPNSLGSKTGRETNPTCTSAIVSEVRINGCNGTMGQSQPEHNFRFLRKSKPSMGRSKPNGEPVSTNQNSMFSQSNFRSLRISRRGSEMQLASEISEAPGTNGSVTGRYTGISQENTNKELSAVKTIHVLLVLIFVTYVPYNISSLLWTYQKFWKKEDPGLKLDLFYFWSSFIGISNGGINAWIIIFGNTKTRRFVASIFRRNRVSNVT